MDELISAALKLKRILDRHGIGFIVVGSLADYLLGLGFVRSRDIDVLVGHSDAERIIKVAREESGVRIVSPMEYREGDDIRGLYGRILVDTVSVDILADVKLRYRGKWLHLTYENLTPCTIEVTLADEIPVKVPCPEIQAVADEALGRVERTRVLKKLAARHACGKELHQCLITR